MKDLPCSSQESVLECSVLIAIYRSVLGIDHPQQGAAMVLPLAHSNPFRFQIRSYSAPRHILQPHRKWGLSGHQCSYPPRKLNGDCCLVCFHTTFPEVYGANSTAVRVRSRYSESSYEARLSSPVGYSGLLHRTREFVAIGTRALAHLKSYQLRFKL